MHIARSSDHLMELIDSIFAASPDQPLLIDRFLQHAVEVDVDALSDGETTVLAGIMEHVEEAGVHSGDSSCVLPSISLSDQLRSRIIAATEAIAEKLDVKGLMNVQYAIKDGELYVLEVNPRASRTVPFVSKATGVPWAKLATRVIMGEKLSDLKPLIKPVEDGYAVKSVVIPFERFVDAQICLGPEMRSTGEVMGQGATFEEAYARAQIGSGKALPTSGPVLIAASELLIGEALSVLDVFRQHGKEVIVTSEVGDSFDPANADAEIVDLTNWRIEDISAWMKKANVSRVVSLSPFDKLCPVQAKVRRAAVSQSIPLCMTTRDAIAVSQASAAVSKIFLQVKSIQERGAFKSESVFPGSITAPVGQFCV